MLFNVIRDVRKCESRSSLLCKTDLKKKTGRMVLLAGEVLSVDKNRHWSVSTKEERCSRAVGESSLREMKCR